MRRAIYRNYIRKCLDNFADNSNVIQFTSDEFTGPTHFVQFWLDTIGEWENQTRKKPIIGLAAPKDVQDAILADPARAALVSVIDIRYWWYEPKGDLYAPPGGKNLTPRQWSREAEVSDFEQSQRAVREYREEFPDKVILSAQSYGPTPAGWAVLMGGGSLPPFNLDPQLLAASRRCSRSTCRMLQASNTFWARKAAIFWSIVSSGSGPTSSICPPQSNTSVVRSIDPRSGEMRQPSDFRARAAFR